MPLTFTRERTAFVLLAILMGATFLLGGSARDDVVSLLILRPLGAAMLVAAIGLLPRDVWRDHRELIGLAFALPLLTLVHLIPLPPSLWRELPGRELAWEIGEVAGISQPWRPLSLVPYRTWNSLWSFTVPLAAFLLALGLSRKRLQQLVYGLALIILASGVLGLLQSIGADGNRFYFYRITNADSAVGLFANRNHQAMLLAAAFSVLAAAVSLSKGTREGLKPKLWLAVGLGAMTLPFLLVTGSRAGLLLGVVGVVAGFLTYRSPATHLQPRREVIAASYRWAGVGAIAAGLVLTTALLARTSALDRMFKTDATEDLRFSVWAPILKAAWDYFPIGSGIGTFVEVYQVVEPDALLSPRYLNHAHNDWLEILLTGGLPALLIVAFAIWYLIRAAYAFIARAQGEERKDDVVRRLGLALIVILALGSFYDYPLRVPSLACLFALAVVWLAGHQRSARSAAL